MYYWMIVKNNDYQEQYASDAMQMEHYKLTIIIIINTP